VEGITTADPCGQPDPKKVGVPNLKTGVTGALDGVGSSAGLGVGVGVGVGLGVGALVVGAGVVGAGVGARVVGAGVGLAVVGRGVTEGVGLVPISLAEAIPIKAART